LRAKRVARLPERAAGRDDGPIGDVAMDLRSKPPKGDWSRRERAARSGRARRLITRR
jgi:hypothetical protein